MTARQGRRVLRPREAVHPWHEPARAGRSEEVAWGVGPSIRVVDFSLFWALSIYQTLVTFDHVFFKGLAMFL